MESKKDLITVILTFIKTGAISFGGGAALLPIFERELVENKKWMDKDSFDMSATISSISPASLPVSFCAVWDSRYALASAYAYTLPGPLLYLVLLTGFSFIGETGAKYLRFVSVGLIAFVLFVLYRFIKRKFESCAKSENKTRYISIMIAVFLLTGGTALRKLALALFGLDLPPPLFSVNMLTLMLITFFIIIFMGGSKSKINLCAALILAGLYALAKGKAGVLRQWATPLLIAMVVLAAGSLIYETVRNKGGKTKEKTFRLNYRPLLNLLFFILIAAVFTTMTYIVSKDANVWDYSRKVLSSSLTSFGGGEVYIGVSEAAFVQTGFIPEQAYNTQIVGIANTLPGPILVHIVTGIGYIYGNEARGVGFGWLFGLLGLVMAITATAAGAITLSVFFEILKDSRRLRMIVQYIMPVVCGTLISIALSLLTQASSVLTGIGANVFLSIGIVLAILFAMVFLHHRYRLNDLWLLLLGGAGTLAVLGMIA